jgi:hypothetical protein
VREGYDSVCGDISNLPITVSLRPGRPKTRRFVRLGGCSSGAPIAVHNNSLPNVLRGLRERVYLVKTAEGVWEPPPAAKPGVFNDRLGHFRAQLLRCVGTCIPYTQAEFLSTYTGSRRRIYEAAFVSLGQRALTEQDARIGAFAKGDKVLITPKKPDPAPRIIQPRGVRYNAVVGPYIKKVEHCIYRAIARIFGGGGATVMKGLNAVESAHTLRRKWDSFSTPVGIGLDASRFDQHVGVQALRYEHSVYNGIFRDKELARVLGWQLHNEGSVRLAEAFVKYKVHGNRMSGDMNTSLGNCLLMCAMVHAYATERGVRIKLANNGDDCMVIMEARDLGKFREGLDAWFTDMGFTMVAEEPVYDFERVEFCQTRPVWNGQEWVMCRSPFTGLAKDSVCLRPDWNNVVASSRAWAHDVGVCGLHLGAGLPILQSVYQKMAACAKGKHEDTISVFGGLGAGSRGLSQGSRPITALSRASMYWAYGILPDEQLAIEAQLAGVVPSVAVVSTDPGYVEIPLLVSSS